MTVSELKYMIAVSELSEGGKSVRLTAVAKQMGVTKVSAYKALERLSANGYIARGEKKIFISEKGAAVLAEYRLIVGFLQSHLIAHCHTPADTAYCDALGAACAFGDVSRKGIADYIKSRKADG